MGIYHEFNVELIAIDKQVFDWTNSVTRVSVKCLESCSLGINNLRFYKLLFSQTPSYFSPKWQLQTPEAFKSAQHLLILRRLTFITFGLKQTKLILSTTCNYKLLLVNFFSKLWQCLIITFLNWVNWFGFI